MENVFFSSQSRSLKASKLKKVIHSKLSDVSNVHVQTIVDFIDIDKQHYVKATRNPQKFLNIITDEDVCTCGKRFQSNSKMIYGVYKPGIFIDKDGRRWEQKGYIDDNIPAAAVKTIVSLNEDLTKKTERFLVIYEPKITSQ